MRTGWQEEGMWWKSRTFGGDLKDSDKELAFDLKNKLWR